MKKPRLAIIAPHPVPYHTPLYQALEVSPDVEAEVLYCDMMGVKPVRDEIKPDAFSWDVPLLNGYKYRELKNQGTKKSRGLLSRINLSLLTLFFRETWDAVLLHGYDTFSVWLALVGAKLSGTRVFFRGEGMLYNPDPKVPRWLKRAILWPVFKLFDAVFYSCSSNKDYFKFLGVPESKLHANPCAVNNSFFRNEFLSHKGQRDALRESLGIGNELFVVVYSARMTARKRQMDLLKAKSQMKDVPLGIVFLGDGPDRPLLERYVKDEGLEDVHFAGFVNQSKISQYYALSDLSVVLSDYDNSPKALNEVMNFELPVIVTDNVGTAEDLVSEGENGFVIPVGDVSLLIEKIRFLMDNQDLAKRMGEVSLEIVSEASYEKGASSIVQALCSGEGRNQKV